MQGPFEGRIEEWNRKLSTVSEVLEAWLAVQRNWLYLQPIFESPDINKQLPTEGKKFSIVDKNWRMTISSAKGGVTKVSGPRKMWCILFLFTWTKGLVGYVRAGDRLLRQ